MALTFQDTELGVAICVTERIDTDLPYLSMVLVHSSCILPQVLFHFPPSAAREWNGPMVPVHGLTLFKVDCGLLVFVESAHTRFLPLVLQLAKEYGMDFFETSACTNYNIKASFTRLTELVLQAHKKELDGLRVSINHELSIADLEEDDGQGDRPGNSQKVCWC
ncbi:RAB15 protein, partial [Polypterus senegalus]